MLSQREYLALAKKVIKQSGRLNLLKDDEAIGEIVSYIMRADIKFDPEKGMQAHNWRLLNGRYGVQVYMNKRGKKPPSISLEDVAPASNAGIMDGLYINEIYQILEKDESITEREREIFKDRHMEQMSLRQIGSKHNLTHERIRQILSGVYTKIRSHYER